MKVNNILFCSKNTVSKPMCTSGHDYRGMKVEKEEGRQREILPNSSGPNQFNSFRTGTDQITSFNQ